MDSRVQYRKGCVRTLVLELLSRRPMYGYEIATTLALRSEQVFSIGQGTLYPLLYSLEKKGLIRTSREERDPAGGRRRLYYELTPKGKRSLEKDLETWSEIVRGMTLVLRSAHAPS
ncbi:MAG: helix-turn-helix transcriptional regulator [Sedimentisphaerales bacterium]|nr:helix-turn-helix transcriptional regulator [Sedimentisphaerales bacterium]